MVRPRHTSNDFNKYTSHSNLRWLHISPKGNDFLIRQQFLGSALWNTHRNTLHSGCRRESPWRSCGLSRLCTTSTWLCIQFPLYAAIMSCMADFATEHCVPLNTVPVMLSLEKPIKLMKNTPHVSPRHFSKLNSQDRIYQDGSDNTQYIGREGKKLSTVSESDHERSNHLNPGPPSVWKDHNKDTYRNSNYVIFT